MNIKLTLEERLKDLRMERHLTLEALAEQTGLSKSALAKYEGDDVTDISLYAVTTLAEFYGVTTDYLLGMTENKKRPDTALVDLHLSDGAVDVLRNGKFNHRLLCELMEHPTAPFPRQPEPRCNTLDFASKVVCQRDAASRLSVRSGASKCSAF